MFRFISNLFKKSKEVQIVIRPNGLVEHLHDDSLDFSALGKTTCNRASHVEPIPGVSPPRWEADLEPVGGPLLRGEDGKGFLTRKEALTAEVAWINTNHL